MPPSKRKAMPKRKIPSDEIPSVITFRANVKALREGARRRDGRLVSLEEIAKEANISKRTLMYQLAQNPDDGGNAPTLRTVHAVAKRFGLQDWQVLLPDLVADLLLNPQISEKLGRVVQRYQRTTDETRAGIDLLAPNWPERNSKE
jgi:hypothetical protein